MALKAQIPPYPVQSLPRCLRCRFFVPLYVQGRDAGAVLNRLATANVDGDEGVITYTQFLSDRGTLQADLTVTKLPERSLTSGRGFLVVATDTAHRHVESLLNRGIGDDHAAVVTDVSGAFAQINLQGPRSREVLSHLTSVDVTNEAFPFRAARQVDIGCATALATRITYVRSLCSSIASSANPATRCKPVCYSSCELTP
jgi:glycine cleavage system aminomethyltransferase T